MVRIIDHIETEYILGKGVRLHYINRKGQKITSGTFSRIRDLVKFIQALKASQNKAFDELRAKME